MNPFIFGNPVRGKTFVGRQRAQRQVLTALNQGSSVLITGEPRMGKTSLLLHIQDHFAAGATETPGWVRYLDAHTLYGWSVPQFWQAALEPVQGLKEVRQAFLRAERERFGTFVLESLFHQLHQAGQRLILLIDEFDVVLDEPGLNQTEFYGGLRSLASRFDSLSLVVAARQSLDALNQRTQEYSRSGSPYFNFMKEITIGPFTHAEIDTLFEDANVPFTRQESEYLARLSGGHPYLLQVAAHFWHEFSSEYPDLEQRCEQAVNETFAQVETILRDTWRLWTPHQQMAFTLAALEAIPRLIPDREFDVNCLLTDLPNLAPEQRQLIQRGFLREDARYRCGVTPVGEMMTWFLAEELIRLLRPTDPSIAEWLRAQQWDGYLKPGEREAFKKALLAFKPLLENGLNAFVKATVEAFARRVTGG
ncbi:AAA-like domain-containing protein [Chloroflexus sp.]|uniref:AAA-like domain-containing protein n=1 Tax=Chloroflexus sp. TaxID=1904827 RepID=UPI00404A62D5